MWRAATAAVDRRWRTQRVVRGTHIAARAGMAATDLVGMQEPAFARKAERRARRTEPRPAARDRDRALARLEEGPAAQLSSLMRVLAHLVRQRPIASLAVAIGVGFLVGGALSFRAGRVALAAAGRRVAREVLKQVL
jgi:hypothetical protein